VGVYCTAGCLLRGMGICPQDGVCLHRFLNIGGSLRFRQGNPYGDSPKCRESQSVWLLPDECR